MAAKNPSPAMDKEKILGMAAQEMEYRVELFNKTIKLAIKRKCPANGFKLAKRLTHTCFNKCIEKRYKEGDLNMGETSCVDRCVSKYWQVTNIIGHLLASGRPTM